MKRPYQIAGLVIILVAGLAVRETLTYKYYTDVGPGPGFFPLWLSILLGLSGVAILCEATFKGAGPMPVDFIPSTLGFLRIGAIIVALAAVVVLMKPLGFRLTMFGFQFFLLLALGRQRLPVTVLVSLAGSFGVYEVFTNYLDLPLPLGELGFWPAGG